MDFSFLSSASAKQFFTVFSRSSSHLSAPQTGLLQWITNLAGRPWPALTAAEGDEMGAVSGVPTTKYKDHSPAHPSRLPDPRVSSLGKGDAYPHPWEVGVRMHHHQEL